MALTQRNLDEKTRIFLFNKFLDLFCNQFIYLIFFLVEYQRTTSLLKEAQNESKTLRQELVDYKLRATKVLQVFSLSFSLSTILNKILSQLFIYIYIIYLLVTITVERESNTRDGRSTIIRRRWRRGDHDHEPSWTRSCPARTWCPPAGTWWSLSHCWSTPFQPSRFLFLLVFLLLLFFFIIYFIYILFFSLSSPSFIFCIYSFLSEVQTQAEADSEDYHTQLAASEEALEKERKRVQTLQIDLLTRSNESASLQGEADRALTEAKEGLKVKDAEITKLKKQVSLFFFLSLFFFFIKNLFFYTVFILRFDNYCCCIINIVFSCHLDHNHHLAKWNWRIDYVVPLITCSRNKLKLIPFFLRNHFCNCNWKIPSRYIIVVVIS